MFSISYLMALVAAAALLALGWFLNQWLFINKTKDFRVTNKELQKENTNLKKQINKENKAVDQLKQKSEAWKLEFQALTKESQALQKNLSNAQKEHEAKFSALEKENSVINTEKSRFETSLNKLQKEHEKLQEKYKRDVADGKNWRTDRDAMDRELKNLNVKVGKLNAIGLDYKTKYEGQADQIGKLRVLERELRMTKAKAKKLTEDVTYWEKKHYDTHHELASLKTEADVVKGKYEEVEQLRKGDEILKSNLMDQIQEFKTKFVNVNNKYRELTNS